MGSAQPVTLRLLGLVLFTTSLVSLAALAQVPNTMSFTSTLSTPDGQPRDGTFDMTFQVFPVPAGGSPLFGQTILGVVVRQGQFTVLLSGFPDNVFKQGPGDRYVQIQVQSETPILPRQHLVSVPFAQRTASVDGAQAGSINGALQVNGPVQVNGPTQVNGAVQVTDRLHVGGSGGVGGGMWLRRSNAPADVSFVGRGADSETVTGIYSNGSWRLAVDDSGSVSIPTGDLSLFGKNALRGSDSWLRLNQDLAFSSGVYVRSLLAPYRLNVGGTDDPGANNAVIAGSVGVGTVNPQARLDVAGDAQVSGQIRGTKGVIIYQMPAGCGGTLTTSPTCSTPSCGSRGGNTYFYTCSGSCGPNNPQSCSTSSIGRLVAP